MIIVLTSLLGIVGIGYIGAIIAYMLPRAGEGAKPQDIGKITPQGVTGTSIPGTFSGGVAGPFTYDATGRGDAQGIFLVQTSGSPGSLSKNDYLVLEQTCRHLGCPVAWTANGNTGTFNCPCHGSVYTKTGQVQAGPAPAPLYKHDFSISNSGELTVRGRI
jgi:Rieske Fe-S protein